MADTFFDRIQKRLEATNQAEEAASKRAGRNRGYIRDLKRKGSIPSAKNIAGLAAALECSSEYLLGLTDDPSPRHLAALGQQSPAGSGGQLSQEEELLIAIYRSLPDSDKQWIWQQVLREAEKAGIAVDASELPQL